MRHKGVQGYMSEVEWAQCMLACGWRTYMASVLCVSVCANFVSSSDCEQGDELLRTFSQMCGTLSEGECV